MKYLVLTANFAPRAASPAIRAVNIVKQLAAIENTYVKVITYDELTLTSFSTSDSGLTEKVPKSVEVLRVSSGPIRSRFFKNDNKKSDSAIRNKKKSALIKNPLINILLPDPHIESVYSFYKAAVKLIDSYKPDVVITHAYPFSFHVLGYLLKKKYSYIKWVADYGDPWFGRPVAELKVPAWREKIDYIIEKKLLAKASLVTLTTSPAVSSYKNAFGFLENKAVVMPMGFDQDDMEYLGNIDLPDELKGKFLITHTGRIYPEARDPLPFIDALDELCNSSNIVKDSIRVVIVGDLDGYVSTLIKGRPCESVFYFVEWVPAAVSISWMKSSDLLLLFGNKGATQIPGKVFQYLGVKRPIFFSYINEEDPTKSLLEQIKSCYTCKNETNKIMEAILCLYRRKSELVSAGDESNQFSWGNIVKELDCKLKSL